MHILEISNFMHASAPFISVFSFWRQRQTEQLRASVRVHPTAGQHCLICLPSQQSRPLALHVEQPPGDLWPLASHGVLILALASGSTAVAAEGSILGPQLGSRVTAGPPRQHSSRELGPDTDVAVQQLKGRAVGGATFEAMPISGLKMYATLVKLSSFYGTIATNLRLRRSCQ